MAWQPTLESSSGEMGRVLVLDAERGHERYRCLTIGRFVRGETGWVKGLSYAMKKHDKLVADGFEPMGVVKVSSIDPELKKELRLCRFSEADLKSALQKYVRRGDVQKTVDCAWALEVTNRWWLYRRAVIVAAEDVGWQWTPWAASFGEDKPDAVTLANRWGSLAAANAKSREVHAFQAVSVVAREGKDVSMLEDALRRGDLREAGRVACASGTKDPELWRTYERFAYDLSLEVTDAARMTASKGAGDADAAFMRVMPAMAILDPLPRPEPLVPKLEPKVPRMLDWWAVDGHSMVGRWGLGRVAKRYGLEYPLLKAAMFWCEASKVVPETEELRWKPEALEVFAGWSGWSSYEEMERWWSKYAPAVQRAIESILAKQ